VNNPGPFAGSIAATGQDPGNSDSLGLNQVKDDVLLDEFAPVARTEVLPRLPNVRVFDLFLNGAKDHSLYRFR
jgi:hypothetical protein